MKSEEENYWQSDLIHEIILLDCNNINENQTIGTLNQALKATLINASGRSMKLSF